MGYETCDGRVLIRALEYHVVDHCNLRCDHCCSYSPLLPKWQVDPEEFERDLRGIKRAVAPKFLKIVGGEPLLHPELERLLVLAKAAEVAPRIQLTTNGMFIDRMTSRCWECLSMLTVSLYPEPALSKAAIRSIAREAAARRVEMNWKVQDRFTCLDRETLATPAEARQVFAGCWIRRRCNSIRQGRFYCCTRPQYVRKLAADPHPFLEDGVEIDVADAAVLAARVREHLERSEPLHTCFLCHGGDAPLDTHRQMNPTALSGKRELLRALAQGAAVAGC